MSNYVISDVHGQYKTYRKMLKKIALKSEDTLFVLGDVIDRGNEGLKILFDLMKRPNVVLLLGNHELLMMNALRNFYEIEFKDRHDTDDIDLWLDPCNGGESTYEEYLNLPEEQRIEVIAYLESSWIVKKVNINNKTFHLSHAYTCKRRFQDGLKYAQLPKEEVWDVVWNNIYDRTFLEENGDKLYPNKKNIYISGHTYTQRLDCVDEEGRGLIYHNTNYHGYNVYNIDCGMALKNKSSQLGCLRLDDGKAFYVPLEGGTKKKNKE